MCALALVWPLAAVLSSSTPALSPASRTASVTPPVLRGVAKNGAAIVVVPSTSPWTVAALEVISPDHGWCVGLEGALPAMQAAAHHSAGPEALVEVSADRRSIAIIVTTPSSSTDRALKAIDAALRARSAGPRAPASTSQTCSTAERDAATQALVGRLTAAEVAVAVVGPGPGPELVRRAQAAVTAPLLARVNDRASTVAIDVAAPDDGVPHHEVPVPTTRARAALWVLAAYAGLDVHPRVGSCLVGVPAAGRAALRSLQTAPMTPDVVAALARTRRLELAASLADTAALARLLAHEANSGDDTWALVDALAVVDAVDVAAMVARVLEVQP
jgi:hypothetical protein